MRNESRKTQGESQSGWMARTRDGNLEGGPGRAGITGWKDRVP